MFDINKHVEVIEELLNMFNASTDNPFILKGGTALMECYALDRLSEDIDLDAPGMTTDRDLFFKYLDSFCLENGYTFRLAKNTQTVGRGFIHYPGSDKPLKVEVSYRRAEINPDITCLINNIKTYTLDELCLMKTAAYLSRDKIRDLYDVCFICTKYYDTLSNASKDALRSAFEYKDLSQFDYLVKTDTDYLVDVEKLETMFLKSFENVGLMISSDNNIGNSMFQDAPLVPVEIEDFDLLYPKPSVNNRLDQLRGGTSVRPDEGDLGSLGQSRLRLDDR